MMANKDGNTGSNNKLSLRACRAWRPDAATFGHLRPRSRESTLPSRISLERNVETPLKSGARQ